MPGDPSGLPPNVDRPGDASGWPLYIVLAGDIGVSFKFSGVGPLGNSHCVDCVGRWI